MAVWAVWATLGDVTSQPAAAPARGSLGLVQGTALYIASVLGTGLLVLPGLAAEVAGPASIVAVIAVLGLSVPLAGTFAVLAARYPDPGGVASYVRRALGDTAARMTGYWFMFGVCAGAPVVAVLGGEYVAAVAGIDRSAVPIIAAAIFIPPFVSNAFGVRIAGWVQFVLTALLLAVVVGVVAVAAPAVEPQHFTPFLPHGWAGVGTAISLFIWAFAGWEVGTHISGEFRNPRRIIPIATAIALVVTGACYLVLQVITVGALGDTAGDGQVPLLELARLRSPGAGAVAVGIIAGIVALGVLNAYLAAFAKLGASLAVGRRPASLVRQGRRSGRGAPARARADRGRRDDLLRADGVVGARPDAVHPRAHQQHGRDLRPRHGRRGAAAAPRHVRVVARGHRGGAVRRDAGARGAVAAAGRRARGGGAHRHDRAQTARAAVEGTTTARGDG